MNKNHFSNWFLGLSVLIFLSAISVPKTTIAQLPWPNECSTGCCHCGDTNICKQAPMGGIGYTYCVSGHVSCGYAGSECDVVGEG